MYPEKKRSNWWYLLPILFSIIGGIIAYYAIKQDEPKKAKYCLCIGLLLFLGAIGGGIAYFILKNDDPEKAKIFLILGLVLMSIGIIITVLSPEEWSPLEDNFGINVNV